MQLRGDSLLNFLLIYDSFNTGGIETLIIRMSRWFLSKNYKIKLFLRESGNLISELPNGVRIKINEKLYYSLLNPLLAKNIIMDEFFDNIDTIICFRPSGILPALQIKKYRKEIKLLVTGLFHPDEINKDNLNCNIINKINYHLFRKTLDNRVIFFMNEITKKNHEVILNFKFTESKIFPLPVIKPQLISKGSKGRPFKILSIGNLKKFKSYNLTMIDIAEKLKSGGIDFVYHIFGKGDLENNMRSKIKKLKLENHVKIFPQIEYSKLNKLMIEYDLFIGMGTTAIEASICGLPTIVAVVDDNEGKSNGLLNTIQSFNCGEFDPDIKQLSIFDLILEVYNLSEPNYYKLVEESKKVELKYELNIVMSSFLNELNNLIKDNIHFNDPPFIYLITYYTILKLGHLLSKINFRLKYN